MMSADFRLCASDEHQPDDEQLWSDLREWLLLRVKGWVYHAHLVAWSGQRDDIVEDIVQETLTRTLEYIGNARCRGNSPIVSHRAFCRTIAYHIFIDGIREDKHMVHLATDDHFYEAYLTSHGLANPEEIALDHLELDETVASAARAIVNFPAKRRAVLLMHLANSVEFDASPSLLEQSLAEAGFQLCDYVRPPSQDAGERSRQASLLWHAHKQLRKDVDEACS